MAQTPSLIGPPVAEAVPPEPYDEAAANAANAQLQQQIGTGSDGRYNHYLYEQRFQAYARQFKNDPRSEEEKWADIMFIYGGWPPAYQPPSGWTPTSPQIQRSADYVRELRARGMALNQRTIIEDIAAFQPGAGGGTPPGAPPVTPPGAPPTPPGGTAPPGGGGGSPGTPPGTSPPPGGTGGGTGTPAEQDAFARLQSTLDSFGLSGLTGWLWDQIIGGEPESAIFLNLRKRLEYLERFSGMAALSAKNRAISEAEYIDLERQYAALNQRYNLPQGFFDTRRDFGTLIGGEVSPSEWQERLEWGVERAAATPQETRQLLQEYFGYDMGALASVFLDINRSLPLLKRQFLTAQMGGAGLRTGYGISRLEAERLTELGVTEQQAQEGLGQLGQMGELFGVLPGEERARQAISRGEQLGAAFEGSVSAQQAIRRRRREREAEFEAGGGFATTREGVAGLGSANR